ncbi:YggT family protein [Treponema sp. R80B11-R83G3]
MRFIFGILAGITGIYSIIIFIRIIFSWFGNMVSGKPVEIINKITDPYLDWWRQKLRLTIGTFDFSVIPAIVFLSFIQNIFRILSVAERITIGLILAQILLSIWNIFSIIIGFFIIVIIIRLIGYFINSNIYSPFWSIIDSVTQPLLYRMNRIFFGKKIGGYLKGIILSLLLLILILAGGKFIVFFLSGILYKLPI